jgi:hypothetical protein
MLLGFISLSAINGSAQYIFTKLKPIKTQDVTIDKNEGIQLKDSIPFSKLLILDSRYDTTSIGFYSYSYLVLKDLSYQAGLQKILEKYYQPLCLPDRDRLLIQLEKLRIEENMISQDSFIYAAGYVEARLYRGRNNVYTFLGTVDTSMQEPWYARIKQTAHRNGKNKNYEFWDYYLLRLYEAVLRKASALADTVLNETNPPETLEEITEQGLAKREKPILKADSLRPGFYRDFPEFINNNPTFNFVNNVALKNVLKVMHYNVDKNESHEEPDTTYWGYTDGEKIFVRYSYDFYQVERRDGGFYIAPTPDAMRQDVNASGANVLFGLLGAAVGIATGTSLDLGGFSAVPAPYIPRILLRSGNHLIVGLQIDWDTGGITF